ncbi:DUF488 domain-containing protein [Brevundimonas sp. 2R-24]|uniref:DUF488 domain-containing protein n=1 Tax=Peiella sedimenti TaxID=3061083 RepID=A0ABT8SNR2_9CAUL|nr:DUF488 domain-containing protein [Caulobacteraceae bacterium XZ-24]
MDLFTIGYEKATLADVIGRLKAAGVKTLIDVRAIAASRRAGFSKTILSNSLNEAGIDYVHLRGLGSPKSARQAARAGRVDEMREIFTACLAEPEAQVQLERAADVARESPSALLCYEADHAGCHRSLVADRLADRLGARIVNL